MKEAIKDFFDENGSLIFLLVLLEGVVYFGYTLLNTL